MNVSNRFLSKISPFELVIWCCELAEVILQSKSWCEILILKLSGIQTYLKYFRCFIDEFQLRDWKQYLLSPSKFIPNWQVRWGFCYTAYERPYNLVNKVKVCRWIYDVNVYKERRWAPNIRGDEFQHVHRYRTMFIKSKKASFPLYINSLNPDFQNFDFFYQVIVKCNCCKCVQLFGILQKDHDISLEAEGYEMGYVNKIIFFQSIWNNWF